MGSLVYWQIFISWHSSLKRMSFQRSQIFEVLFRPSGILFELDTRHMMSHVWSLSHQQLILAVNHEIIPGSAQYAEPTDHKHTWLMQVGSIMIPYWCSDHVRLWENSFLEDFWKRPKTEPRWAGLHHLWFPVLFSQLFESYLNHINRFYHILSDQSVCCVFMWWHATSIVFPQILRQPSHSVSQPAKKLRVQTTGGHLRSIWEQFRLPRPCVENLCQPEALFH